MKKILLLLTALSLLLCACSGPDTGSTDDVSQVSSAVSEVSEVKRPETSGDTSHGSGDQSDASTSGIKDISYSGKLRTDYDCALNLIAEYTVNSSGNNEVNVTVTVLLECRQIAVSPRQNLGKVYIGDEKFNFSTPQIENYEKDTVKFELVKQSRTMARDENGDLTFELAAEWPFRGVYSGIEIGDMRVECRISLHGDGSVEVN